MHPKLIVYAVLLNSTIFSLSGLAVPWEQTRCLDQSLSAFRGIEYCNQALQSTPQDAQLLVRRGQLFLRQADYPSAIRDFTSAIKLKPNDLNLYLARATAYMLSDHKDLAQQDMQRASTMLLHPQDEAGYLLRGLKYAKEGKFAQAIEDFSKAIEFDPTSGVAYLSRGNVYSAMGKLDLGLEDFNRALNREPRMSAAYHSKALALFNLQEYEEAVEVLTQAIDIDPTDAEAWFARANNQMMQYNVDAALKDYAQVLRLNPGHIETYNLRAQIFAEQGEYEKSLADYSRLIQLEPDNGEWWLKRAGMYGSLWQMAKSIDDAQKALKLGIEQPAEAHRLIAGMQLEMDQVGQAITNISKVISANPDDALAYYIRGRANYRSDRLEESLSDFTRALELEFTYAYVGRAYTYALLGKWELAHKDISEALKAFKNRDDVVEMQGWIYFLQGNPKQAQTLFRKIYDQINQPRDYAPWISHQLPHLLKNFPGLEKSPRIAAIRQDLTRADQGSKEALVRVYETMIQILLDWKKTNK